MKNKNIPDILKAVIKTKQDEIEAFSEDLDYFKSVIQGQSSPLNFAEALTSSGLSVIAEIKRASPSVGIISKNFNPLEIARAYYEGGADAVSVLTDKKYFHGDTEHIRSLRPSLPIPILRKDFIIDPIQIYETRALGADTFLLIAAILSQSQLSDYIGLGRSLGMEPLVEVHTKDELEKAVESRAKIIGVNNRNLHNFKTDIKISESLISQFPDGAIPVSESGIKSAGDARRLYRAGFSAILAGEILMRAGLENCGRLIAEFKNRE